MAGGIFLAGTSSMLAQTYSSNAQTLSADYIKVANGQRYANPNNDIVDFLCSANSSNSAKNYSTVRTNIQVAQSTLNVVESTGNTLYQNLSRMSDLVKLYNDPSSSAVEKQGYTMEFSQRQVVAENLIDNSYYNGQKIISDTSVNPLESVYLDPHDQTQKMDIGYSSQEANLSADIAALSIGSGTALADVQTQVDKAGNFLATTTAFQMGLTAQLNMSNEHIDSDNATAANFRDSNAADNMNKLVSAQINAQTTLAMIAQCNSLSSGILKLLS